MIWKRCVLLLAVISATGCGTLQLYTAKLSAIGRKKSTAGNKEPQEILLGVIEMVNPEHRFVLIRSDTSFSVAAGTQLEARSTTGIKTKLVVTPEKKLNFVSADIVEGYPQAGESVFITAAQQAVTAPVATAPGSPPPLPQPRAAAKGPPGEPTPGVPPDTR